MTDRYPPGGCVLTDKTRCDLPHATCCHEGRMARWPRCTCPLGCNAPWQSPCECPLHSASVAAAMRGDSVTRADHPARLASGETT